MGKMTRHERAMKEYLTDKLAESGYLTYSEIFHLFDLRLISNPTVIGYMEPGIGRITLNETLDDYTLCLVIRHEIMHEYLNHERRLINHVAQKMGIDPHEMDNIQENSLREIIYGDSMFNYAADYEISNRAYTDQDKKDIRRIRLNGQIVSGLVTDIDHPDWVDLPLEDMYDKLEDEMKQMQDLIDKLMKEMQDQAKQMLDDASNTVDDILNDPNVPDDIKDVAQQTKDILDKIKETGTLNEGELEGLRDAFEQTAKKYADKDESSNEKEALDKIDDIIDKLEKGQGQGQGSGQGQGQGQGSGQGQGGDGEGSDGEDGDGKGQGKGSGKGQGKGSGKGQGKGNGEEIAGPGGPGSDSGNANVNRAKKSVSNIIHGTFKHGKFYDLDGNEIIPGR